MYFNGVKITDESIYKTRKWFYDNAMACIEEVKNGEAWVNDHVLAFLQRAYYIQTGESIPLLSF